MSSNRQRDVMTHLFDIMISWESCASNLRAIHCPVVVVGSRGDLCHRRCTLGSTKTAGARRQLLVDNMLVIAWRGGWPLLTGWCCWLAEYAPWGRLVGWPFLLLLTIRIEMEHNATRRLLSTNTSNVNMLVKSATLRWGQCILRSAQMLLGGKGSAWLEVEVSWGEAAQCSF